jgi:hypothetical protein
MEQQPDPILAWTTKTPTSEAPASQEDNRVTLDFQHQFSQIQVNLKNANNNSIDITGKIQKVELLGVSTEGYVPTRINADGTVSLAKSNTVADNTSFEMFSITPVSDYLYSCNAIVFGTLRKIRITWFEGTVGEPSAIHTPTLTFDTPITLESGKRYVYNLTLSRGSLNVISTSVVDWELSEFTIGVATVINE